MCKRRISPFKVELKMNLKLFKTKARNQIKGIASKWLKYTTNKSSLNYFWRIEPERITEIT